MHPFNIVLNLSSCTTAQFLSMGVGGQSDQCENVKAVTTLLLPITLPYRDLHDRIIQLWKYKGDFAGTVIDEHSHITTVSADRIQNPLSPQESGSIFLQRIAAQEIRKWDLV